MAKHSSAPQSRYLDKQLYKAYAGQKHCGAKALHRCENTKKQIPNQEVCTVIIFIALLIIKLIYKLIINRL